MRILPFTRNQLIFALLFVVGWLSIQKVDGVNIVNFPLTNNNAASAYSTGNSSCTVYASGGRTVSYDINAGASTNTWGAGTYWATTAINTSDFYSITLAAQVASTDIIGPMDFKIQYSLDNSTWTDVSTLQPFTSTLTALSPTVSLPAACAFQSTVYIRILNYTNTSTDGTPSSIDPSGSSFLKGLVIAGEQLQPPSTQASNITLIAITPTTIQIGCTQGSGSNRIIVMNTSNTFTDPVNDYNPTANTVYGSGEQVIYNGTGTSVTVSVPSSSNDYWFRVYDYNQYLSKTRYNISTNTLNPKECHLESIITPTYTDVRLTTAYLGATITNPPSGTITERGIYWSSSPGVSITSNKVAEGNKTTGTFSFKVSSLTRSSTIYFKAYVNNLSGTSFTEEMSFSNVPIFNGTGNWEDNTKWNVQEVPGSANYPTGSNLDKPIINGTCAVANSNTTVYNLTINSGKSLIINPAQALTVSLALTNSAGVDGILIKADPSLPNGSLKFRSGTVSGSVEMYSKASTANSQNHWQYFGIPVTGQTVGTTFGGYPERVRKYDESNADPNNVGLWYPAGSTSTLDPSVNMVPIDGYEVVQPTPKTYTFKGQLYNSSTSRTLQYTPGANWAGQNILANPYTAAIDISKISFGSQTEQAVYLYNTGSLTEWTNNGGASSPGSNPGTYIVSTPSTAGTLGVPSQIPSMQGFLVKALSNSANATFGLTYTTAATPNTSGQRVKEMTAPLRTCSRVDLIGDKNSDCVWLFSDPTCTKNFDNGWDGKKMLSTTAQIYAAEADGDYQIDAVNNVNNTILKFQPGSETSFKLVFTHQNINTQYSAIYLVDLLENKTIDVTADGSEYSFTSSPSTVPAARFKIIATPLTVTGIDSKETNPCLNVFSSGKQLFINNPTSERGSASIYNLAGVKIRELILEPNRISSESDLPAGIYIVNANTQNQKVTQRLVIQ